MKYFTVFIHSLIQVRGRRFIAAAAIALCMLFMLDAMLRFGLIGYLPECYLLRDERDNHVHASWALAQARFLPPDVTPIYIFGGSGMREAITSDSELAQLVNQASGNKRAYKAFIAATPYRISPNDLSEIDLLPRPGIVVLGVNSHRIATRPEPQVLSYYRDQLNGRSIMGRNQQLIDFLAHKYPDLLPMNPIKAWLSAHTYLLPATRLIAEKLHLFHFAPIIYKQHTYIEKSPIDFIKGELERWQASFAGDPEQYFRANINLEILRLLIESAQSRGNTVLMVEQTMDYDFAQGKLDPMLKLYRRAMEQLAKETGTHYSDFERGLHFPSDDFGDLEHLKNDDARRIFTAHLAVEIARVQPPVKQKVVSK